jgi:hypothetical protein
MFKRYTVEITLTRDMLGTNSMSPDIHAEHIIGKARKIMAGTEPGNKKLDKFIDALPITDERELKEKEAIIRVLEERSGKKFPEEEKAALLRGELSALKETVEELEGKGITVFFRDNNGKPCIGDHMVKGFMKAAGEAICKANPKRENGKVLKSASYTDSLINQHVAIAEQFITFDKDIVRDQNSYPKYNTRSLRAMTMQGPRVSIAKSEVIPAGAKLKFTLKVMDGSQIDKEVLTKLFDVGQMTGLGQWRNAGYGQFDYKITEQ